MNVRTDENSGSCHSSNVMSWTQESDEAQSIDQLQTSRSITGKDAYFETLDAKVATALKKILNNTKFRNIL